MYTLYLIILVTNVDDLNDLTWMKKGRYNNIIIQEFVWVEDKSTQSNYPRYQFQDIITGSQL